MGNPQDLKRQVQREQGGGTEKPKAPIRSRVLDEFIAMHAQRPTA